MTDIPELLRLRNRLLAGIADEEERADFAALAGELGHLPSIPLLVSLADDPDEIVRYNAICSLVLRLGQRTPQVVELCWRRFDEDDDYVGGMALACLSSIHFGSQDLAFFDRLERILRSPETPPGVLETAYTGLFQVAGLPPTEWPDRMVSREPMRREEIDWMKVAQLRAGAEAEAKRRPVARCGKDDEPSE